MVKGLKWVYQKYDKYIPEVPVEFAMSKSSIVVVELERFKLTVRLTLLAQLYPAE